MRTTFSAGTARFACLASASILASTFLPGCGDSNIAGPQVPANTPQTQNPTATPAPMATTAPTAPGTASPSIQAEQQARAIRQEALIAEAEKHLQLNSDGTLSLKSRSTGQTRSVQANLSPEARAFAEAALLETNKMVKAGEIQVSPNFTITKNKPSGALTRFWGSTRVYWWGVRVTLDNRATDVLTFALGTGDVQSAMSTFTQVGLRSPRLAGWVGILMGAWGHTIDYVNNRGGNRGVEVNITWATFIWVVPRGGW